MAAIFTIGERKIRPDIYFRYEKYGTPDLAGATDGVCAVTTRSSWGPMNAPVLLERHEDVKKVFGPGGTTAVPYEAFRGGARRVYAVRLGSGGTKGTYSVMDTSGTPVLALSIEMLHPGSRPFQVTVRDVLDDPLSMEFLLLDGTTVLQKIPFLRGADEALGLFEAYQAAGSEYFTMARPADLPYYLAPVDQAQITPGTDPTVTVSDYSDAFEALEPFRWNCLAVDTDDVAVHALVQAFVDRIFENGQFAMGVVGDPESVSYATRISRAAANNDYRMIYVGHDFLDSAGVIYEGPMAAARFAGMVASTPSNESLTHRVVAGAVGVREALPNSKYEQATQHGMITFSTSAAGQVWVESGINTLVTPGPNEDEGWKKIKRTKVRFELIQRLNDSVEPLIGKINNDPDGRATVLQVAQGVLNNMIAEQKLLSGANVVLDASNPPKGDSAWFTVYADDIDAFEKGYFTFMFRFAPEN
jgi:hypothetical protein